jgi:CubicO group peptidase (beta-lactamase class C family)
LVALSLAALVVLSSTAAPSQDGQAPQAESLPELKASFTELLAESLVPGAQAVIIEDGEVVMSYVYGVADVEKGTPVTEETIFRAGSVSKSFLGVAIMAAVEEDLLDLETPIAEAAPDVEFSNPWEASEPVRLVHVLEHTAGFFDVGISEFLTSDPQATLEQGLALGPIHRVSRWPPGTRFSYANSGPPIAALALEKVTGRLYEDYLDDTVLRPLGMTASSLLLTEGVAARIATSYRSDGVTPMPYTHIVMRPSGALNTTALEMARLVRMMIDRGRLEGMKLLEPASVARIERSGSLEAALHYGLDPTYGLGNGPEYADRLVLRGHDGGIDGFLASYAYSPELRSGVVLMTNSGDGDTHASVRDAAFAYLTRDFEPQLPPAHPRARSELATYAGAYKLASPRNRFAAISMAFDGPLKVTHRSDQGLVVAGVPRIPKGEFGFRRTDRAETSFVIVEHPDGTPEIRYPGNSYIKVSTLRALAPRVLPLMLLIGMLMPVLYHPARWLANGIRRAIGRPAPTRPSGPRGLQSLSLSASLTFLLAAAIFIWKASGGMSGLAPFATVTPLSLAVFLLTLIAPVLAAAALLITVFGRGGTAFRRAYYGTAMGFMLAGFVWIGSFGWVGLRTWTL